MVPVTAAAFPVAVELVLGAFVGRVGSGQVSLPKIPPLGLHGVSRRGESTFMALNLEASFDEAMMRIYVRAKSEVGYNATRYLQMLHDLRGLETARMLVLADQPSEGYTALWERGRLDLTVEALVLQSEWQPLFGEEPELLERARRRLSDYGYKF
jgi:hypothetical protein